MIKKKENYNKEDLNGLKEVHIKEGIEEFLDFLLSL